MSSFTQSVVEDAALAWLVTPRNMLLLKLISRDLRMKEAERVIEGTTV